MKHAYEPASFESKWQERWLRDRTYGASVHATVRRDLLLTCFRIRPENSMHIGHPRGYVGTDVYSRMKRMQGFRVLHPMGWDAFGLPAEETAIANKEYPAATVARNVEKFKAQLNRLGLAYDWDREISTTDPRFYGIPNEYFWRCFGAD